MECLGGNGYVEEAPLARLYREAPLNGIWEGSGNVVCLDVLRSFEREPESLRAVIEEIGRGGGRSLQSAAAISAVSKDGDAAEFGARRIVESIAIALQASLMERHATPEASDAFFASRLLGEGGRAFGTLPSTTRCAPILERAQLVR
jgi:putative acyl-CoA dehydrogenase